MRRFYAREVVEEQAVSCAVDACSSDYHRFNEAYDALKWLLARKCDEVPATSVSVSHNEYLIYKQAGDPIAGTPEITVVFEYDDDQVVVIGLKAEQVDEEFD